MKTKISEFEYGILDLDGTVLDNRKLYRWLLAKVLSFGFSVNDSSLYLPTGGLPLPGWAKLFQKLPGLSQLVLAAEKVILKLSDIMDWRRPRLFEEAQALLSQLSQKGIKLFATTGSKTQKASRYLEKTGILSFFVAIAGSEIPKREHIPHFARKINLPLEDFGQKAFLVSDGPVDLNLAAKWGIYPIGVSHTLNPGLLFQAGAKEVISNLRELID